MIVVLAALFGGVIGLGYAFYLAAAGLGVLFAALGLPAQYGAALANVLTLLLVVVMLSASLLSVAERKWSALIQDRVGANRITVFGNPLAGLPFLVADAVKMLTKEAFVPGGATRTLFRLAPILSFAPVFALFAIVPVGPEVPLRQILPGAAAAIGQVGIALQIANPDAGLIFLFAISSLSVYGTSLAGWASNNKLALLGGVRASSQMISYEVSLGLSLVGTMIAYRTLRLEEMVVAQGQPVLGIVPALGILLQPIGFLIFFASGFAETKRAPFDLPEGESEIVGYFIEYSGMQFGLMFLAEFIEIVVLSGVVVAIFLGGWHPIFFEETLKARLTPVAFAAVGAGAFLGKMIVLMWVQMLIRWVLPRFRYDQIQHLCWKILLPTAIANIFVTGAAVLVDPSLQLLAWIGAAELLALFAVTAAVARRPEEGHGHGHAAHGADSHGSHGQADSHGHSDSHGTAHAAAGH
jgi:NADH-quinone oxidoreductase subunit H